MAFPSPANGKQRVFEQTRARSKVSSWALLFGLSVHLPAGCSVARNNPGVEAPTCAPEELACPQQTSGDSGTQLVCVNVEADPSNCGCCGNRCADGMTCNSGRCEGANYFGFFVFGDAHIGPPANDDNVRQGLSAMRRIDPNAIAVFSNGDLTDTGSKNEWARHDSLLTEAHLLENSECSASFGSQMRYFASVGDHDIIDPGWYDSWSSHLGISHVSVPSTSPAVYFSLTYANTLFIILDSEHVSSAENSYSDPQTQWLASQLVASGATHKFLFFHRPTYSCNGRHEPFSPGLPWIDLAEKYGVGMIFNSHTHVYERSCPRAQGTCTGNASGVVFVQTGALGGTPRDIDMTTGTVTGTNALGEARTDSYTCSPGSSPPNPLNDFCHVGIDECKIVLNCYRLGDASDTPFDSWTMDNCLQRP